MNASTQTELGAIRAPIGKQRTKNLPTSPQRIALAAFQHSAQQLAELAKRHEVATNAKAHAAHELRHAQAVEVEKGDKAAADAKRAAVSAAETTLTNATGDHTRAAHALADATQTYLRDKNAAQRLWGSRFGSIAA